jgi:uncharacterized protein YebE (UPF0316 family)
MDYTSFLSTNTFTYMVLPLLIFLARICDVTLDTVRVIYLNRGMKHIVPILGFFEVLIWLLAIGQIMKNLTSPIHYIAYASGFAAGNWVGIMVEEKLSVGTVLVRVITKRDPAPLIEHLRKEGHTTTVHEAYGETGPSKILFTVAKRKEIKNIIPIIKEHNPNAFYTIEDMRYVSETQTPKTSRRIGLSGLMGRFRKTK